MKKLIYILLVLVFAVDGQGATITSTTGGGNWSVGSTWVGGNAPASTDDVVINGPVVINQNVSCRSVTVNSTKTLSYSGSGNNLTITNSTWSSTTISVSGTFNTTNGIITVVGSGNSLNITNNGTISIQSIVVSNVRVSFGNNTTIVNTLRFTNGSYLDGTSPIYGSNAVLEVAQSMNYSGNYYLWPDGNSSRVPPTLSIVSGTVTMDQINFYIKKSIIVASGATFNGGKICMYFVSGFTGITNNGTLRLGGITVSNGAVWDINANYTVSTLKIENGGTVNANSYALTIDNSLRNNCNINGDIMEVQNGGTFNAGTSTVVFNPAFWVDVEANNIVGGIVFNNVQFTGSNTVNIPNSTSMTVNGNININSGANVNQPQNINVTNNTTVTNSGSTSGGTFPPTLPAAPSGSSGGGTVSASRWAVPAPSTYEITSNMTFTGTPKVVIIQEGATLLANGYTITCDSVYINGVFNTVNASGLTGTFGSAVIVMSSTGTVNYAATTGTQTITPRSDYTNVTLSGNGQKNFSASTYEISGNFTVTGASPTFDDNTVITFDGTTQNISCPGFKNVNFSNSGTKTFTSACNITGVVTVSGTATVAANNFATLKSTATGTASINTIPAGASVTGNWKVERYIPVGRKWRFLSTPVNGGTFASNWQQQIHITGPGTGGSLGGYNSNGFDWTQANNSTVFWYDETVTGASSTGWTGIGSPSDAMVPGRGYRVFVRGDKVTQGTSLVDGSNTAGNEVTMRVTGPVNTGSIPVSLSCSNGCTINDGWNLIGNPYPSTIDWNNTTWAGVRNANVGTSFYIFNPNNNQWGAWSPFGGGVNGATRYIASGQSFFVKVNGAATLTFEEAYKVNQPTSGLFGKSANSSPVRIKISLMEGTYLADETVIFPHPAATSLFDAEYDGEKPALSTGSISTYTAGDTRKLIFNAIPENTGVTIDTVYLHTLLPASLKAYSLEFEGVEDYGPDLEVVLYDNWMNIETPLIGFSSYAFGVDPASPQTYAANRFYIMIRPVNGLPVTFVSFQGLRDGINNVLRWTTASEINNSHFVVERSFDGKTFDALGIIKGKGNSNVVVHYGFIDKEPGQQASLYRLKQVNYDGTYAYSSTILLGDNKNFGLPSIAHSKASAVASSYPSPAEYELNIDLGEAELSGPASIEVYDQLGKLIYTVETEMSKGLVLFDVYTLNSGVYYAKTTIDSKTYQSKFIKK